MLLDKDQELEDALKAVEAIEPDWDKALRDYYAAKAEREIAYSEAFLNAEGTEKAREAAAKVKVAARIRAEYEANAIKTFLADKLKNRQDAVSARQSLLSAEVKTNSRL